MNIELFIARKTTKSAHQNQSRPLVRIAIVSIVLGLSVMVLSVAILKGFQKEIRDKVIGFGAHIRITHFDSNKSFEPSPISQDRSFYPDVGVNGVTHIQVYATKAGILKTSDQIEGVVLKGVGTDYNWDFFSKYLIAGTIPVFDSVEISDEVLLSQSLASLLHLSVGDPVRMYFIIDKYQRARKFKVSGIYETGMTDFDNKFILGDLRHIQRLNGWEEDQVGGFELLVDDFDRLDEISMQVYNVVGYDLNVTNVRDLYPEIFDWLKLQDMNVVIILIIMVLVSSITMISTLLILILERTNMIGVLKSLGMTHLSVRKIFLYKASFIIVRGLLFGNALALLLVMIQKYFKLIKLDQASYFVSEVPVHITGFDLLWINAGTLLVCLAMMLLPSYVVLRISPVKAIRFD